MNVFKMDPSRLKQRLIGGFTSLLLIITVAGCLFFTLQSLSAGYVSVFGTSVFRVVTGSMEPEIPVGSLLISKQTPIEQIKEQDIICYRTDDPHLGVAIITHRVVGVFEAPDGSVLLQTKGDANPTADPNPVSARQLIGRVEHYTGDDSKMAGFINFITSDFGFLACILVPVILIAAWVFRDAVKSIRTALDSAKKQLAEQEASAAKTSLSEQEYEALYRQVEEELRKEMEQDVRENTQCADDDDPSLGSASEEPSPAPED